MLEPLYRFTTGGPPAIGVRWLEDNQLAIAHRYGVEIRAWPSLQPIRRAYLEVHQKSGLPCTSTYFVVLQGNAAYKCTWCSTTPGYQRLRLSRSKQHITNIFACANDFVLATKIGCVRIYPYQLTSPLTVLLPGHPILAVDCLDKWIAALTAYRKVVLRARYRLAIPIPLFQPYQRIPTAVRFAPTKHLAIGFHDGTVIIHEPPRTRNVKTWWRRYQPIGFPITHLAWYGQWLFAGTQTGLVCWSNPWENPMWISSVQPGYQQISDIAIRPDGMMAIASYDGSITLWQWQQKTPANAEALAGAETANPTPTNA